MENRVAVIGIMVNNRKNVASKLNAVLSDFGDIIMGRLGIVCKERGVSVISIVVDANNDQIGALTGKIGNMEGVKAKVALMY